MSQHQSLKQVSGLREAANEAGVLRAEVYELRRRLDALNAPRAFHRKDAAERDGTLSEADSAVVSKIRRILKFRDIRARVFQADDLFADPAWDMLLEIFVADLTQHKMPVSSACMSARVPATTGLRWLKVLERQGLIRRFDDPHDRRRVFVSLTPEAFTKMRLLVETREFHFI